jgi:secreted trypsin-like serine protease
MQKDEGGPLYFTDVDNEIKLIGIVGWSSSNGCHDPGVPARYAKVAAYKCWIQNVTGKNLNVSHATF